MFNKVFCVVSLAVCSFSLCAAEKAISMTGKEQALALLKQIETQNDAYARNHGQAFFNKKDNTHVPVTTFVACSDARVHTDLVDERPEGELFSIRNIGNQMSTALGSVKYGINHLKTPLLLIVGHTQCGAIIAARGDYSHLEPSLVKELDSLHISKKGSLLDAIKENVNDQVATAMKKFESKVEHNELLIVGAVYDFTNEMKHGAGKLNVINIQGKKVNQ